MVLPVQTTIVSKAITLIYETKPYAENPARIPAPTAFLETFGLLIYFDCGIFLVFCLEVGMTR